MNDAQKDNVLTMKRNVLTSKREELLKHPTLKPVPRMRIFCDECDTARPFYVEPMHTDQLNKTPYSDILCALLRAWNRTEQVATAWRTTPHREEHQVI